ncbi:putative replication protein A subunit [Coleophoma crateriformis]|uniref:Putative replication protein A subunit n=1 Tax=Coleophoma crateriformis TaxID=565419 RepID=A0A3D8S2Z6_9HELO|nr:putative replication protein A subunit [Coleophoma crateriformis]
MANNYGYGGGNTTYANYGANGGADGGGFVAGGYGGSQGGSQDSPSGTKTYGKDTLRPVTIKQIIDATQPHPEADFKIDGSEVTQLTFIGQIQSISAQATNTTFKLDDGTGLIEVKQWVDSDADPENARPQPKEGDYIHVWGRLKAFNNKRHVGAHVIRPIIDFNEISMHLLEATAVHLYFTRGPLESGAVKQEGGNGMFVGESGGMPATTGGKQLPNMSKEAKRVYELLLSAPQNNEGLHVHNIAAQLGMPNATVFKAGDELLGHGIIYTTVDDETWAVLEY